MNFKTIISSVIVLVVFVFNTNAQESSNVIEDVILYKSEAHLVRMTKKGKILAFIKDVDNNYASLNKVEPQVAAMETYAMNNTPDLAYSDKSRSDNTMASNENSNGNLGEDSSEDDVEENKMDINSSSNEN